MNGIRPAAAAVLALLALAPFARAGDPPPAPPPEEPAPPDPDADRKALEDLVARASPVVAKARGLEWKSPVAVAPVTTQDFVDRYMRDFTRFLGGEEKVAPAGRLLARLRILPEGGDLRSILGRFLEGNVAANYDPMTKKVSFLPGAPRTLPLMVHELTHAMDDQHFDMKASIERFTDNLDFALAYGMLSEGDAQSVETRFLTQGASAKQDLQLLRNFADGIADAILKRRFGDHPPALVLAFKSQYTEGMVFAESLRRSEKGEEAMNEAFRKPPASTEQALHPEKYVAGEAPVPVAFSPPPEGGKVLFETTLGELGTRVVLVANSVERNEAREVAAGWGGDRVALVSLPGGEALVWTTTWDTEADALAFYECMYKAFEIGAGADPEKPQRGLLRNPTVVDFIEAPLDALPAAIAWVKRVKRP